jgi:hypothetical protein
MHVQKCVFYFPWHTQVVLASSMWHDAGLGMVWRQVRRSIIAPCRAEDGNRYCIVVDKVLPGPAERSTAIQVNSSIQSGRTEKLSYFFMRDSSRSSFREQGMFLVSILESTSACTVVLF